MSKTVFEKDDDGRSRDFEMLKYLLRHRKLKTAGLSGAVRAVQHTEFMWMHEVQPEGIIGFKHSGTRNYVFLVPWTNRAESGWTLHVPERTEPFMRGEF